MVELDGPTIDDAIQALRTQRWFPNPETLADDLDRAVFTMEWLLEQLIKHIEGWIQVTDALKQAHEAGTGD